LGGNDSFYGVGSGYFKAKVIYKNKKAIKII
jgi:hypothetical protein